MAVPGAQSQTRQQSAGSGQGSLLQSPAPSRESHQVERDKSRASAASSVGSADLSTADSMALLKKERSEYSSNASMFSTRGRYAGGEGWASLTAQPGAPPLLPQAQAGQLHCYAKSSNEAAPYFDAMTALGLVALGRGPDSWEGIFCMEPLEARAMLHRIQMMDPEPSFSDEEHERVSVKAILDFVSKNQDLIKALPPAVHGLLNTETVDEVLGTMSVEDGLFEGAQWDTFLHQLGTKHLQYLLQCGLASRRAFFARGQRWWNNDENPGARNPTREELETAAGTTFADQQGGLSHRFRPTFQCSADSDVADRRCGVWFSPPGLWEDFWYFSANNHPLHSILSCDPNHCLGRLERVLMELSVWAITLCIASSALCLEGQAQCDLVSGSTLAEVPANYSVLLLGVSGLLIWRLLFILLATPFGHADPTHSTELEVEAAWRLRLAGLVTGLAICIIGCVAAFLRIQALYPDGNLVESLRIHFVFSGRLAAYFLTWASMMLFQFNPFVAWGQPDPSGVFFFGDLLGLGQWRIEKQRFQALCIHAIDKLEYHEPSALLYPIVEEDNSAPNSPSGHGGKKSSFGGCGLFLFTCCLPQGRVRGFQLLKQEGNEQAQPIRGDLKSTRMAMP